MRAPPACSAPPAARGKKMTRSASRGTSSKPRTIAPRGGRRRRSSGPPPTCPASSWRRNSSTRRSSSSGTSTSPSASSDLAVTGLHSQQPHRSGDYGKRRPAAAWRASPASRRVRRPRHVRPRSTRAQHVDRARAAAEAPQAVADGRRGGRARGARGVGQRRTRARGAPPASRSACSPSRARRRRGGGRRGARRARRRRSSRSVGVARWPPVTTTARARAASTAWASSAGVRAALSPASTRASGRFGVTTVARGRISATSAICGVGLEQPRPGLGDHDGVDDDRRARRQERRARRRPPRWSPPSRACRP